MKFCPECGTKVEGMKFCPECGLNLQAYQPSSELNIIEDAEICNDYDDITYEESVDGSWKDSDEVIDKVKKEPEEYVDDTWRAPAEFYYNKKKSYTVKDSQMKLAQKLGIADTPEEITIAHGSYSSTGNCHLAYVIGFDVYFVTTSISKQEVHKFSRGDSKASKLFNPAKLKLDIKDFVGFKFTSIDNEIFPFDIEKIKCTEFEIIRVIAPDYARKYFMKNLYKPTTLPKKFDTSEMIEKKQEEDKLKEYEKNGIPYCPKCHSTSLSANKKGFGIGKAVIGAAVTGGIGLTAGNINAKKVRLTCMNCGYQFWPGKK